MNKLARRSLFGFPLVWFGPGTAEAQPSGTNTTPVSPGQYPGTLTNNNASAGNIGEFVTAALASTSAATISTGVGTGVCSAPLTAGDWDVWGQAFFHPVAATVVTVLVAAVSTTAGSSAAGIPTQILGQTSQIALGAGVTGGSDTQAAVGPARISLGAAATAWLNASLTFSGSTAAVYGVLQARRAR